MSSTDDDSILVCAVGDESRTGLDGVSGRVISKDALKSACIDLIGFRNPVVVRPLVDAPRSGVFPAGGGRPEGMRWVPPGGSSAVDGRVVTGGFVHVGSGVRSLDGRLIEPSLVDPTLDVDWDRAYLGASAGRYLSYSSMGPCGRAGFLKWIGGERCDPSVGSALPTLVVAAIERHLVEVGVDGNETELDAIVDEVSGLLEVYGPGDAVFARHAASLLQWVRSQRIVGVAGPAPRCTPDTDAGSPGRMDVPVGLGNVVAAGEPIPAAWAWSWYVHSSTVFNRVATRCFDEFEALFKLRYRQRFGDGIMPTDALPALAISHMPASPGVAKARFDRTLPVPDARFLMRANGLNEIAKECLGELKELSKFRGRHGDESSVKGAGMFPAAFVAAGHTVPIRALQVFVNAELGDLPSALATYEDAAVRGGLVDVRDPRSVGRTLGRTVHLGRQVPADCPMKLFSSIIGWASPGSMIPLPLRSSPNQEGPPSATQVSGPTSPSTSSPTRCWNSRTA